MWPSLIMVHGKPRHPQSQGSVERANADIKDMLTAWLADNETTDWTVGLKFVQFHKNSSFHSGIKRTPFAALFGSDAKIGLTTSSLPDEIISRLEKEEDLLNLFEEQAVMAPGISEREEILAVETAAEKEDLLNLFEEQAVMAPGLDTSGSSLLMPAEVTASPGTPAAEYTNPVETAALDIYCYFSAGWTRGSRASVACRPR
ncbi:KRAB-A domain-containing protein 2-like [Macrobrachium rosenbergii]|uniref:KRAB-A domain-containing protein 2-like n=1 Tax=Macrobrachium rosenbergii TaxID=79674 RepID=UPI0034D55CC7